MKNELSFKNSKEINKISSFLKEVVLPALGELRGEVRKIL
jgi:hypothetical protein